MTDATSPVERWPSDPDDLIRLQDAIALLAPPDWEADDAVAAGCFVCFSRGGGGAGSAGDEGWAAAVTMQGDTVLASVVVEGTAPAPYVPALLAAREGPLLAEVVSSLDVRPEVVLVNAVGRDHPRRAGLAVQLGWALGIPTVGVTHRPLIAVGPWPAGSERATSPLTIGGEMVGGWVRTRPGARPVAVTAGWQTSVATAMDVVLASTREVRTPAPLRESRRLSRLARAAMSGSAPRGAPRP